MTANGEAIVRTAHSRCGRCGANRREAAGLSCSGRSIPHVWKYAPTEMTDMALRMRPAYSESPEMVSARDSLTIYYHGYGCPSHPPDNGNCACGLTGFVDEALQAAFAHGVEVAARRGGIP